MKAKKVCITSVKKYYYRVDNLNSVMTKFSLKQITGSREAQKILQQKMQFQRFILKFLRKILKIPD